MSHLASSAFLLLLAWLTVPPESWLGAATQPYDFLIKGGQVIDGSGNPAFRADVAVRGDRIAAVGRGLQGTAVRIIDAAGQVVTPGFIDLQGSPFGVLVDGRAESKVRQGVTTEVFGESGSAGPVLGPAVAPMQDYLDPTGIQVDWSTLDGYFRRIQRQGTALNIASYVGVGQLRLSVMGNVDRPPTDQEMKRMESLLAQAMEEGALGLSSGLPYPPNSYASRRETILLARVAARYGGIYATHMRSEGSRILEALDEAISVGEEAGLPVHIAHLKVTGRNMWGRMGIVIEHISRARSRGVELTAYQYPYLAGMGPLQKCIPPRFQQGTATDLANLLGQDRVREQIRQAIENGEPGWESNVVALTGGFEGIVLASVRKPENKIYEGRTLHQVASLTKKDPVDALLDLLVSEEGKYTPALFFHMSEEDVRLAMKQPWVAVGSDGIAVSPSLRSLGQAHPRFYGTYPRILGHYVREKGVLSLADAVRKMTSLPAQIVGLPDRGLLKPGMAADLVIFDPESVNDRATFEQPDHFPDGISFVVVNGRLVVADGEQTEALPGKVLYGPGRHPSIAEELRAR